MVELTPFVFWAQNEQNVTLKVDLKDSNDVDFSLTRNVLLFRGVGKGAKGHHEYNLKLNLQGDVEPKESGYKVLDSHVFITLRKAGTGYWPRLISNPSKPAWLKIDFDRWTSDDATADDEEQVGDVRDDYPHIYENLQKEERGYRTEEWKKVYLVFYNLCQFVGFFYILTVMGLRYASEGINSIPSTYENVGNVMKLCQLFQWLEVMHPIFGYTKNNVLPPLLQVGGRGILLFALIDSEPRMQPKPVVFYLFIVWSSIEVIRYPYYISQLYKINISALTWIRYTIWIPLYPLGFLCEGIIFLRSIPYFEETKRFSVPLPNSWNFAFDTPSAIRLFLLTMFIPGMYTLMMHMYRDRSKKLGTRKRKQL